MGKKRFFKPWIPQKMSISEILQQMASMDGENDVLLVREVLFWWAYEYGALVLCERVQPFKRHWKDGVRGGKWKIE